MSLFCENSQVFFRYQRQVNRDVTDADSKHILQTASSVSRYPNSTLDRNGPLRSTYRLQATQDPNAWDARDERSMDLQPTRTESLAPLSGKVSSNPIESDLSLNLSRGTCGSAPGREEMHRSPNSPGSLDRSVQPNSTGYRQGSDALRSRMQYVFTGSRNGTKKPSRSTGGFLLF
jgi:hypothetical protein